MHLFRHISQKASGIHKVFPAFFVSSARYCLKNTIPVIAEELGAAGYNTAANDERNKGAFVMGAEAMDINTLLSRSQSLAQSKGKGGEK